MNDLVMRALDDPRLQRKDVQTLARTARALPASVRGETLTHGWAPMSLGTVMRLAGFRHKHHAAASMRRLVITGYLERRRAAPGVRAHWEYRVRGDVTS